VAFAEVLPVPTPTYAPTHTTGSNSYSSHQLITFVAVAFVCVWVCCVVLGLVAPRLWHSCLPWLRSCSSHSVPPFALFFFVFCFLPPMFVFYCSATSSSLLQLLAMVHRAVPTLAALWRCCQPLLPAHRGDTLPLVAAAVLSVTQRELQLACDTHCLLRPRGSRATPVCFSPLPTLARVFFATLQQYSCNVQRWMTEGGMGDDSANEFFVSVRGELLRYAVPSVFAAQQDLVRLWWAWVVVMMVCGV